MCEGETNPSIRHRLYVSFSCQLPPTPLLESRRLGKLSLVIQKSSLTMGDVLCGPSNALQQFQKHSTTDRTLQQDRLQSRQSPAQVGDGVREIETQNGVDLD